MTRTLITRLALTAFVIISIPLCLLSQLMFPVKIGERTNPQLIELTEIGNFGLTRKERPTVPEHLHTGIDIKRPDNNYHNQPVYAMQEGKVISIRDDGPFAVIIIEHEGNPTIWTVYEHISGIQVELFESVNHNRQIARFMNKSELNKYGWQFDHLHFEILKEEPLSKSPDKEHPRQLFKSHTLNCFDKVELNKYFHNPIMYISK